MSTTPLNLIENQAEECSTYFIAFQSTRRRPYPSSKSLIGTIDSEDPRPMCALLRDAYRSIGHDAALAFEDSLRTERINKKGKKQQQEQQQSAKNDKGTETPPIHHDQQIPQTFQIDDCQLSTILPRQHERYLHLVGQPSHTVWNESTRKEFRSLRQLVRQEQMAYGRALRLFWAQHSHRLLEGFQEHDKNAAAAAVTTISTAIITAFVQAATHIPDVSKIYHSYPTQYQTGNCQLISFPTLDVKLNFDLIESKNVVAKFESPERTQATQISSFKAGDALPQPYPRRIRDTRPLQDDQRIRDILAENHTTVDVVTTAETLETLLQDPVQAITWIIPVTVNETRVWLESPLPHPYPSPRSCLVKGMEDSLFSALSKTSPLHVIHQESKEEGRSLTGTDGTETLSQGSDCPLHRYVLCSFPTGRRRPLSVLVRVTDPSPVMERIRISVQYFPERGREIPSNQDRALWLLDSVLRYTQTRVALVDPRTCRILEWESTSRAHALLCSGNANLDIPPEHSMEQSSVETLWTNMIHILTATRTIESGYHVLRFPAQFLNPTPVSTTTMGPVTSTVAKPMSQTAISVHKAGGGDCWLDYVSHSNEVRIDAAGLQSCFRPWKWTADRIPFTFPTAQ